MANYETIIYEKKGPIAYITLNRPDKLNALSQELQQELAAAAVVTLEEHILYDPQVKDRNVYQWLTFLDGVADPVFRVPWVLPKTPTLFTRCGPYAGEHNDYVLCDILGMSKEEVAKLAEENVIGATPGVAIGR